MIKTFRKSDLRLTYGIPNVGYSTTHLAKEKKKKKKAKILLFYNKKKLHEFCFSS